MSTKDGKSWKIEWAEIDSLTPHPRNPNQHDEAQIKRLAEIIDYQGWRHPIVVSKLSGHIVAGHGRLMAARALGLKLVPVHLQEFENADQEMAFLIGDNAIASWAELDMSAIQSMLPDMHLPSIDLLGIKSFEFEPEEEKEKKSKTCPSCGAEL